ncbi:zinc finger Ran-binding domain-containing protein [Massilia sp. CF038]|uniref:zinc finger Ran-binding domain-containing protein n=1 Tax=Massilia sp. CF038 TaxID=1881045 RepID=UPI001160F041|nr:zinc finger Ran-binding domain-containing protein [Massilia sp. CF038]
MKHPAPAYDWTCQRCRAENKAHTERCSSCGFGAHFTAQELAAALTSDMEPVGGAAVGLLFVVILGLVTVGFHLLLPDWPFWLEPRLVLLGVLAALLPAAGVLKWYEHLTRKDASSS